MPLLTVKAVTLLPPLTLSTIEPLYTLDPVAGPAKVSVTLPTGEMVTGTLASRDEFTIALKDASGATRSWPTNAVKFTVDDPLKAHFDLLSKYTDDDMHNIQAYLQTLK